MSYARDLSHLWCVASYRKRENWTPNHEVTIKKCKCSKQIEKVHSNIHWKLSLYWKRYDIQRLWFFLIVFVLISLSLIRLFIACTTWSFLLLLTQNNATSPYASGLNLAERWWNVIHPFYNSQGLNQLHRRRHSWLKCRKLQLMLIVLSRIHLVTMMISTTTKC